MFEILKFLNVQVLQVFCAVLMILVYQTSVLFITVISQYKCSKDSFKAYLFYAKKRPKSVLTDLFCGLYNYRWARCDWVRMGLTECNSVKCITFPISICLASSFWVLRVSFLPQHSRLSVSFLIQHSRLSVFFLIQHSRMSVYFLLQHFRHPGCLFQFTFFSVDT